ncbi:hypothetical protein WCX49_01850 [Sulfurimonas sp. HSL-1656]|uniref:hypothetical protein n=1 Tax=Thiomicrolovo subterrani TaxID=3131934 RepID=UPI0031F75D30
MNGGTMELTENRLVDEARREPVKNAFRLGWEFVERNRTLALTTLAAFMLLSLLELIPLLGMVAAVALGVFAQAVQIYIGRTLVNADTIDTFIASAEQTTFAAFMTRYQAPAFGAWLAWFVMGMGLFVLWIVLVFAVGIDPAVLEESATDEAELIAFMEAMGITVIPMLVVGMLIAYVYPIAQGRVILSDTFGEAFKAVFSVFTPAVWQVAAKGEYFRFVFYLGLAFMGIAALLMVVVMLLVLVPFLGPVVMVFLMAGLFYPAMMILGIANVLALRIAVGD